jgi:hypothetical protein
MLYALGYNLSIRKWRAGKPWKSPLLATGTPLQLRRDAMQNVILRYASLTVNNDEIYSTAELLNGSGYLFRVDGERQATLVSYKDANLMLYGFCDVVTDQYITDELRGGPAGVACSRQMEVQ